MPELPDVEAMRRNIEPDLVGRIFSGVTLNWPNAVKEPSAGEFQEALPGATIKGIGRRAKYFIFDLDGEETLIVHLRMTGSLRVVPDEEEMNRFTQTIFQLDNERQLRFVDPRKFGAMWLVADVDPVLGRLGPEPLEEGFTPDILAEKLSGKGAPIKALLLEQELIAGIGNIYADDILFESSIHPLRRGKDLKGRELEAVHGSIRKILSDAIEKLSVNLPVDAPPTEELGAEVIIVPRTAGEGCSRCGTPVQRIVVRGRGTYFCPQCQME